MHLYSNQSGKLHEKKGKGDWNAFPVINYLVEIAIGAVVIVTSAPMKSIILE